MPLPAADDAKEKTMGWISKVFVGLALLTGASPSWAQQETNAYTRHELLEPASAKFHVFYETSVIQPGAKYYFNPVRKTSTASDVRATDMASGANLDFKLIDDKEAAADGFAQANPEMNYIRVTLPRPVPEKDGEIRIRLEKTYEDHTSYRSTGDTLTFERAVGAPRNAFVLPPGYQLVSSTVAAQIAREADGRIRLSFFNPLPGENPLKIVARRNPQLAQSAREQAVVQRAHNSEAVVYFLKDPQSHAFDLTRDHTEDRAGTTRFANAVSQGGPAAGQYARNLDTGAILHPRISGNTALFQFAAVKPGQSLRLRFYESHVDPAGYRLDGDQLVFAQRFREPTAAVVLPAGWVLTDSASPAMVGATADGRTRLDFINPRDDALAITIRARRAG